MKKLNVEVWWSSGKLDGDGYSDSVEVTNREYEIFREYEGEEIRAIDDPEILKTCERIYQEMITCLKENSVDEWDDVKEDYEVFPDDDEFWKCTDQDKEKDRFYRFEITTDRGDLFIDCLLTKEEKESVYKAMNAGEEFSECKELSDLYEKVDKAVQKKLKNDLGPAEEKQGLEALQYEIIFSDYPEYKSRYTTTFEEYFEDTYEVGVKVGDFDD